MTVIHRLLKYRIKGTVYYKVGCSCGGSWPCKVKEGNK